MALLECGESDTESPFYLFRGEMYPANIKLKYTTTKRGATTRRVIINKPDGGSITLLSRKSACETKINHKAPRLFSIRLFLFSLRESESAFILTNLSA